MVKAKLNEKYENDFLTTQLGQIFYAKNNSFGKPYEWQEIDMENNEIRMMIEQGTLIVDVDKDKISEAVKVNKEIESVKENIIDDNENLFENSIKEVKTKSNDKKILKE